MTNPQLEYYYEMKNIKIYERYMLGTVVLSAVVLVGTVTSLV